MPTRAWPRERPRRPSQAVDCRRSAIGRVVKRGSRLNRKPNWADGCCWCCASWSRLLTQFYTALRHTASTIMSPWEAALGIVCFRWVSAELLYSLWGKLDLQWAKSTLDEASIRILACHEPLTGQRIEADAFNGIVANDVSTAAFWKPLIISTATAEINLSDSGCMRSFWILHIVELPELSFLAFSLSLARDHV